MPAYDASDDDDHIGDAGDEGADTQDGERVAKALARAGVASRREVERLIESGRVALNGDVLTTPAVKVGPGDILTVDGAVIGDAEPTRVFRYHKPPGLLTSHNDPQGRPTVFANLPPGLPRLLSVGRLDLNSEGLLLLTNDGALSRALELPSSGWTRVYRARAFGDATQDKLDRLKAGVTVEGVKYGPIEARLDKAKEGASGRNVWITVTLAEGKNREVRRVLEHLGLKVNRLLRLAYGPFALGDLAQGAVEEIGPRVIREQLEGLVEERNMPRGDRPQYSGGQGKASGGRRAPTPGKTVDSAARAAQAHATAEAKPKTEYKAGWARPKSKPSGHAPVKKGPPKFERAVADRKDRPWFAAPKDGAPKEGANRGRTGRVLARAEDILPGAPVRGPTMAPKREPERKGPPGGKGGPKGKPFAPRSSGPKDKPRGLVGKAYARPDDKADAPKRTFVNSNDGALRDAAAKGAARDAERRAPARGTFSQDRAGKAFPPPARGSGAHRTGRPGPPRQGDDVLAREPASHEGGVRDSKRPPGKGGAFAKGGAHRSEAPKGPAKSGAKSGGAKFGGAKPGGFKGDGPRGDSPKGGGPKGAGPPTGAERRLAPGAKGPKRPFKPR